MTASTGRRGALSAVRLEEEGRGGVGVKKKQAWNKIKWKRRAKESRRAREGKNSWSSETVCNQESWVCDYHRNPKPQACRDSSCLCERRRQRRETWWHQGQRQTGEKKQRNRTQRGPRVSRCGGGLTGAGDEGGRAHLMEPGVMAVGWPGGLRWSRSSRLIVRG